MSSRAWIEVAAAAEARGVRRWALRAVASISARYLMLLVLLVLAGLAYGLLLPPARGGHCAIGCAPVPQHEDRDLLDLIF
jgi:hypothetical protein